MNNSESRSSSGPRLKVGDLLCCIKDSFYRQLPDGRDKLHLYHKSGNFYTILYIDYIDKKRVLMSCETKHNNDTSKWYLLYSLKNKDKNKIFENYFATGIQLRKLKLQKINGESYK